MDLSLSSVDLPKSHDRLAFARRKQGLVMIQVGNGSKT
jgi:hypothetical protein